MSSFSPSVIDGFMRWANRLPGPVWVFYVLVYLVLVLIINGITWLDGSALFGTFDLYRSSIPFYPVCALLLMHHLNRVAHLALVEFRPALGVSDAEFEQFDAELTTLPSAGVWQALGISLVFTIAFALFTPDLLAAFRRSVWLAIVDFVIYVIVFGVIAVFVYHTLHQLRLVSRIHATAKNVNLFQAIPLYAFSGLTAQTGIGLLLLNYFSILTDPATFVNPALNGLTIMTSLIAAACIVLPLKGMHDRIVAEKKRLLAEANTRLETIVNKLYQHIDTRNLTVINPLNDAMKGLITTREVVVKIPTWPWNTGTLAGFISAFLLPFILRIIGVLFP